jgi:hypothetical protein
MQRLQQLIIPNKILPIQYHVWDSHNRRDAPKPLESLESFDALHKEPRRKGHYAASLGVSGLHLPLGLCEEGWGPRRTPSGICTGIRIMQARTTWQKAGLGWHNARCGGPINDFHAYVASLLRSEAKPISTINQVLTTRERNGRSVRGA